jgi:hypothetical protein
MSLFDRDDRQIVRAIQKHLWGVMLREGVVVEQMGTVDVYVHRTNPATELNCVTPHKGVAWVRREDLQGAFTGLERLGRRPRLVILDTLFPEAFKQQIRLMDLTLEDDRMVMVYRPLYGPNLPEEVPVGRLPDSFGPAIRTSTATTRAELAAWLRVFRAGYYNAEHLTVQPQDVDPLVAAVEQGAKAYITATYQGTPLGAARLDLQPPTAQIEAITTAPLWHKMGLEPALTATAVRTALERACPIVFTIAPPGDFPRLHRMGFLDLTHVLIFWRNDTPPEQEV